MIRNSELDIQSNWEILNGYKVKTGNSVVQNEQKVRIIRHSKLPEFQNGQIVRTGN